MVIAILGYILLAMTASIGGVIEAILWSRKAADAFKWNEHIVLNIHRGLIFLLAYFAVSPWIILAHIFSFPFFQAGAYYQTRHYFDKHVYEDGWFSGASSSSTASINVKLKHRLMGLFISLMILIIYCKIL